ncbi:hypothetical protein M3Y94_01072900 [Aphelenchoides besseyi]|nr:hypothetical protein M3Y94_01072900 [Aphelenchoides besseyi]
MSSEFDIPIVGTIAEIERMLIDAMAKQDSQRICLTVVLITHLLKYCEQSIIFEKDCTWVSRLIALLKEVHEADETDVFVRLEIEHFLGNLNTPHRAFSQPSTSSDYHSTSDDMYTPTNPFQQLSTPHYPDPFPHQFGHYNPQMPGVPNSGPQFFFPPTPTFYLPVLYIPVYFYHPL